MTSISYARHRFPPAVLQHAVWSYLRFSLSYRDIEDLLAERGLDICYETIRRWIARFGPLFARETAPHLSEISEAITSRSSAAVASLDCDPGVKSAAACPCRGSDELP
ncbi:hypothetical protein GCM10007874_52180 [Labrys miyagiensis]|uniref:Transposase n=1 Tax=Labrys miyagiensis TaxID=346912 RepID=A0ABQ6CPD1_9HYPH|nr:hypothetical protein GCM10007874_52180 [Labrys miyagiensis]